MTTRIMSVVINTIHAVLWTGPKSHVETESLKRFLPAFADGDPARTVLRIMVDVRIQTALLYVLPRYVLWRVRAAVGTALGDARRVAKPTPSVVVERAPAASDRSVCAALNRARRTRLSWVYSCWHRSSFSVSMRTAVSAARPLYCSVCRR